MLPKPPQNEHTDESLEIYSPSFFVIWELGLKWKKSKVIVTIAG